MRRLKSLKFKRKQAVWYGRDIGNRRNNNVWIISSYYITWQEKEQKDLDFYSRIVAMPVFKVWHDKKWLNTFQIIYVIH